ncbi:cupin domain-containing protein [Oceanicella sp. SM1341]|uniref:cupin domain-containing protein n=1 Tax=Oceanicella sp. SM1341 TaxID=1548889 RepID=UPI000E482A26|nr:cupin [Oceanicella sp. SM1341]
MASCQIFSFTEGLREVVEDGLYMQSVVGDALSVGVVNFRAAKGSDIPPKSHAHGEEATLQLRGGCTVGLGPDGAAPESTVALEEGSVMIMPADAPHSGVNSFDAEGMCLRLNVVTPPRAEYGAKGASQVFYPMGGKP